MKAMARRQLTSCCFALLAFVLVIVPQSAWPQSARSAARTAAEIERLQALAAQIQQGNDQPQQQDPPPQQQDPPPPPQQPQTPPGERPQPGCIILLGVQQSGC
jgi:hypothetical protein